VLNKYNKNFGKNGKKSKIIAFYQKSMNAHLQILYQMSVKLIFED